MSSRGTHRLELIPVRGIPLIEEPTSLVDLFAGALRAQELTLQAGDVLVVAHKVVSKAEGRVVLLEQVEPGPEAQTLAEKTGKDPRVVELILRESRRIVRWRPGLIIAEHRLGLICANAAVDLSNAGPQRAVLLPQDPDESARRLREGLERLFGGPLAVVVADTHGRPFRLGAVGVAIGVAGFAPLTDWRGHSDLYGRLLETSQEAVADELAAAATLLMGQSREAVPAVIVRGFSWSPAAGTAAQLIRPREADLFL